MSDRYVGLGRSLPKMWERDYHRIDGGTVRLRTPRLKTK